jgi:hypothetical protein
MKALVITVVLIAFCMMATPNSDAFERVLSGQLEGLNCIYAKDLCAVDNLDPHIALELDFVLLLKNGDHYLLTNVPREVKILFFGKEIEVTGEVKEEYRAIAVNILKVKVGGQYQMTWTPESKDEEWRDWRRQFYEGGSEN